MYTTLIICAIIVLISVFVSYYSRRGSVKSLDDVLTGHRSFGAFILFFVSVGEIYGIGTMLGVPGAVYSKGTNYTLWFMGYILLSYCVGYFLNPLIWRAGKKANLSTNADFFGWRFGSKGIEVLVAIVGIAFVMPWAQMNFAGLGIVIKYLGIPIDYATAVVIASIVAFLYIGIAGVRSTAWVAVMKDFLMIFAIGVGAYVAASHMPGGASAIYQGVLEQFPKHLVVDTVPWTKNVSFTLSTIVFQSVALYMIPYTFQYVYTGASEEIVRRNQIIMPLYMFMYPFVILAGFYGLLTIHGLKNPDEAFLMMLSTTIPSWVMGIIAGGMVLCAILALAVVVLPVGGLFTKNILGFFKPNASQSELVKWNRVVTASALIISVLLTLFWPQLMLGVINMSYFGIAQFFPGVVAILFWKRATKWGVGAGLAAGIICVIAFVSSGYAPYGLNKGFIAILVNIAVLLAVTYMTPVDPEAVRRCELLHEEELV